jgi:hypothetical protein
VEAEAMLSMARSDVKTNEIVLFHVHDPEPALNFGDVTNETLFDLCVRSIRARSPSSSITLLTDAVTNIGAGYSDIQVIRDFSLKTEYLMYERARLYGEHVSRRSREDRALPIAFLDIDILVNRDLEEVFTLPFDVALTFRKQPGIVLDTNDIPINTQVSPINGGVIFAKPTAAASEFFSEQMVRYDALHIQGAIRGSMVQDIRKWGGDQFALMNMVGRVLVEERPTSVQFSGVNVRFLDCDTYNFSPELGMTITSETIAPVFILHLKGPRKKWMPMLAKWMGI